MSISQLIIVVMGVILALVGLALMLGAVGLHVLGVGFSPALAEAAVGLLFFAVGAYVARGGQIKL